VAGITADANILINYARLSAQRYSLSYQEPIPVEQLVQKICDLKQGYTQYGGLRPFGVSFIYAGWDRNYGFQLYQSDPSGNYGAWKATCIGANNQVRLNSLLLFSFFFFSFFFFRFVDSYSSSSSSSYFIIIFYYYYYYQAAQSILKQSLDKENEEVKLEKALRLAVKVLSKTMDSTSLTPEKLEIGVLQKIGDEIVFRQLDAAEVDILLKEAEAEKKKEKEES